jgi:tetratricopeptide (TPR) repeat protein
LSPENILDSWKAVADYLGHSVRTCQRLEQEAGLPIHRLDGSPKARIFAYPEELDRWLEKTAHHRAKTWRRRPAVRAGAGAAVLIAAIFLASWAGLFRGSPAPATAPAGPRTFVEESGIPFLEEARAAERAYVSECDPKELQRAIKLYEQAVAAGPDSAAARFGLGSCYQNDFVFNGRDPASFEAMNSAYQEALRLAPDRPEALVGMGWSRLLGGQRDEAYVWFTKARDLAPSSPWVNYHVGVFLGHIGLVDKAVAYLSRAIDLGERSTRSYRMRAFYEILAGQFGAAASDAARLCEMNPTNGKMFCAHARALLMQRDFEGAARELYVAAVLSPDDPEIRLTQALLAAARGERDKALEAAREIRSGSPAPSPFAAQIYALLGLEQEAIREIRNGLDLDMKLFRRLAYPVESLGDPRNFVYDKVRDHPDFRAIVEELKAAHDDILARYSGL